jgi:dTDP-4-dehydrorhamnose 3,5-epimerase
MRIVAAPIAGVFEIRLDALEDERGFFARTYDEQEFSSHGMPAGWAQHNLSRNLRRGTLRGLHGVRPGADEEKLVRCVRGRVWDVVVDRRPGSPTFNRWHAAELSALEGNALFIPNGCLHGFQTLVDDTDVFYCMSSAFDPSAATGARFDDPKLAIPWPLGEPLVSPRDLSHPLL